VSAGATATAGALFAAAFAVGELAAGPIADRRGRRPVLLGGLVLLWLASMAVAQSPTWSVHLAARMLQGVAAGSFAPVALAWTEEILPEVRRMTGVALLITAYQAAAVFGQIYGQVVEQAIGWRTVYGSLGVGYLLAAVVLAARLREPDLDQSEAAPAEPLLKGIGRLLRVRPLLASWLLSALLWGGLLGMYATAQLSFGSRVPQSTLLWVRVAGLGAMLVVLPLLRLLRNRDSIGLLLLGVGAAVGGLLGQRFGGGLGWLTAGTMLVAFGTTLAFTPLTDLIGQLAPPGARASALSGQSFTLDMGASAGAALSARIAYTDFCGFLAVGMAASTMVLQVTLESAERHQLTLDLDPPAEDSAGHPASGPDVGDPPRDQP
jgi:MFS transporter, YNFM family, putative membrane transport protein